MLQKRTARWALPEAGEGDGDEVDCVPWRPGVTARADELRQPVVRGTLLLGDLISGV